MNDNQAQRQIQLDELELQPRTVPEAQYSPAWLFAFSAGTWGVIFLAAWALFFRD